VEYGKPILPGDDTLERQKVGIRQYNAQEFMVIRLMKEFSIFTILGSCHRAYKSPLFSLYYVFNISFNIIFQFMYQSRQYHLILMFSNQGIYAISISPFHILCGYRYRQSFSKKTKQTPWPLVHKRTIPTERPPLVDEI
jgi:hypothetical protein